MHPAAAGWRGKLEEGFAVFLAIPQKSREMFKKLSAKSGRTFVCPGCGAGLAEKPERRAQVITCAACETKASVAEWTRWLTEQSMIGRAGSPPPETRISRENVPDSIAWHIPAHGKFGFFLFFGTLWTLITAVVSGGFLFAFLTGGEIKGNMPEWVLIPFFGLFWAIGLSFLYLGVRQKWMTHRLTVANGKLVLRREMFGRSKEKSLMISGIHSIEQKEFYQQNNQSVYGIEIKGARGKLRFGSALDAAEKAWLVADLREVVFGPTKPDRAALSDDASSSSATGDVFSVEIPHSRNHLWPFAIILGVTGAVGLVISMTLLNDRWEGGGKGAPDIARTFSRIFNSLGHGMSVVFFLMAIIMLLSGVALFTFLIRNRGSVRKLEGNSLEIAIRTYRHNLIWKEKTYPRGQITDIRASQSGNSGAKVMKRLELIAGDEVVKVASWVDGAAADALIEQVRPCL